MDAIRVGQWLVLLSGAISLTPCYGFEERPPTHDYALLDEAIYVNQHTESSLAPSANLSQRSAWTFTAQTLIFNRSDLFALLPSRYQLQVEFSPRRTANDPHPTLNAYPSYQLSAQSSLGFSFNHFRPRFNFERAGLQTSLHFRGDGVKLNFRPTAISQQLEFDVKISDNESRLDLTYRY